MREMKHDYRDTPDEHRGPVPVAWFVCVLAGALIWLIVLKLAGCA